MYKARVTGTDAYVIGSVHSVYGKTIDSIITKDGKHEYIDIDTLIEIAKVGDKIRFKFSDDHICEEFRGKTFVAEVGFVDLDENEYGIYAEYGEDFVDFDDCEIIERR